MLLLRQKAPDGMTIGWHSLLHMPVEVQQMLYNSSQIRLESIVRKMF